MNEIKCHSDIESRRLDMPGAVGIWIWICAYLNAAGWTLSAIHQLTVAGYAVTVLVGMAALCTWKLKTSGTTFPGSGGENIAVVFAGHFRPPS